MEIDLASNQEDIQSVNWRASSNLVLAIDSSDQSGVENNRNQHTGIKKFGQNFIAKTRARHTKKKIKE